MAAPNDGRPQGRGYAGDLSATDSWVLLRDDPTSRLVDVRTSAEWSFVGTPDLASIGKQPILVSWQVFPAMSVNPSFEADVAAAGVTRDAPLVFICRSGSRSRAAAIAMTVHGYVRCHNLADGFEGPLDDTQHRGARAGWKAAGLPWRQT